MNTKACKFIAAATVLLGLLAAASLRAGTITVVNLPTNSTDLATGITTNKYYVSAFDYGSLNTTTYSVNGVPFTHVKTAAQNVYLMTNWIDSTYGGQVIASTWVTNKGIDVTSSTTQGGTSGNVSAQADGNMRSLLTDLMYPGNSGPIGGYLQEEFDNLTVGHQYSLRLYYRQWSANRTQNVYFMNGTNAQEAYSGNPLNEDVGGAHYLEYDFTAAATNVFCVMSNLVANNAAMVYASTVEDDSVPYAPFITYEPVASPMGSAFVLNVSAIGTPNLAYQWYVNTVSNTSGATALTDGNGYSGSATNSLTFSTNLLEYYFVVVTNNYGAITSTVAQLNPLPVIETQPAVVKAGQSLEFVMTAGGFPPLSYQWYVNTVSNTSGATALLNGNGYSGAATNTLMVSTNFLDYYFVVVSNNYGAVTSQVVQIATSLTVQSAGEPIWNQNSQTNVVVTFSDTLDPTTSTSAANYTLNNGAAVLSATLVSSNEVVLGTSPLTPATSYTLTVQNVEDYYGIKMTPSPTNVTVGLYPANLALWIKADTGLSLDGGTNTVNGWEDLSGNGNNLVGDGPPYDPEVLTNAAGDVTIQFTAANETFLYANSTPSLAITGNMTIMAVMSFDTLEGGTNGMIVSKTDVNIPAPYDYYVQATNSGAHLYRGNGSTYGQFTAAQAPSLGVPHILMVTMAGSNVTHFLDGMNEGTGILNNNFAVTNISDAGHPLYLGTREDTANRLTGSISELIVAGSAISSYDAATFETYLVQEHHVTISTPTNLLFSVLGNQLKLSWPSDHIGWGVQSNSIGLADSNAWFTIPGSTTTNQISLPIGSTPTNVFYRMFYPQ